MNGKRIGLKDYVLTIVKKHTRDSWPKYKQTSNLGWTFLNLIKPQLFKDGRKDQQTAYPLTLTLDGPAAAVVLTQRTSGGDAEIENLTIRNFKDIELISDRILEDTPIRSFSNPMEKCELGEQDFVAVIAHFIV
jgi:hypothetical protein